jgi:hypothetical protein
VDEKKEAELTFSEMMLSDIAADVASGTRPS